MYWLSYLPLHFYWPSYLPLHLYWPSYLITYWLQDSNTWPYNYVTWSLSGTQNHYAKQAFIHVEWMYALCTPFRTFWDDPQEISFTSHGPDFYWSCSNIPAYGVSTTNFSPKPIPDSINLMSASSAHPIPTALCAPDIDRVRMLLLGWPARPAKVGTRMVSPVPLCWVTLQLKAREITGWMWYPISSSKSSQSSTPKLRRQIQDKTHRERRTRIVHQKMSVYRIKLVPDKIYNKWSKSSLRVQRRRTKWKNIYIEIETYIPEIQLEFWNLVGRLQWSWLLVSSQTSSIKSTHRVWARFRIKTHLQSKSPTVEPNEC
jgi:hypothetical protein